MLLHTNKRSLICLAIFAASISLTESTQAQQFRSPSTRGQQGAVLGGLAGAVLGGIAGHQNDETPEGIAIGGVVGALAGGLAGKAEDQRLVQQYQYQHQAQLAQQQRMSQAVSLQDAIALTQNGVSPTLIMNQINDRGVTHRLAVNDIIHLHKNGVNESVITAMQNARLASQPSTVTRVAQAPAPVVTHRETIFVHPAPPAGRIHIYNHPRPHPRSGFHYHHRW